MKKPRRSISKRLRFEVFKRDSFKCQYCGASAPDVLLHVDHINPIANGGEQTEITNLITACEGCNLGKSDKQLSDTAVASKRKAQLDEMQDRREQLEMISEWQRGMIDLDEESVNHCIKLLDTLLVPFHQQMNEVARPDLKKWIKKFGLTLVMESIRDAFTVYVRKDKNGEFDEAAWRIFWDKIGGFCVVKKREKDNPDELELYRIRGYGRKCFNYFVDWEAMQLLRSAKNCGVATDSLWVAVKSARSFTGFTNQLESLIAVARGEHV